MKTQILNLRSGAKNQITNALIADSGTVGTNKNIVKSIFEKIIVENPDFLNIELFGQQFSLKKYVSLSGKTVHYYTEIDPAFLTEYSDLKPCKNRNALLSIYDANRIELSNGKNSYVSVCPSLIKILD